MLSSLLSELSWSSWGFFLCFPCFLQENPLTSMVDLTSFLSCRFLLSIDCNASFLVHGLLSILFYCCNLQIRVQAKECLQKLSIFIVWMLHCCTSVEHSLFLVEREKSGEMLSSLSTSMLFTELMSKRNWECGPYWWLTYLYLIWIAHWVAHCAKLKRISQ